jgi:hypothetical protein
MTEFGKLPREEQLALMSYWLDTGTIEVLAYSDNWYSCDNPSWYPKGYYRKPVTKPSIDWDQVSLGYNYLATDKDGKSYLYSTYPDASVYEDMFCGTSKALGVPVKAEIFSSFVKGNCDWLDSIVERPSQA